MRFLGLDLPPLMLLMLLAFLWLILLVLLVWSWLRPRRPLEPPPIAREPERASERLERDTRVQLPRPHTVREVRPEPKPAPPPDTERTRDDPFDSYRPNGRRDDFDF